MKKKLNKNLSKKKIIIFAIILLICIISIIMSVGTKIRKQIIKAEMEKKPLLEYEIKNKENNGKYDILVKINSADGLETVKYISEKTKEEVEIIYSMYDGDIFMSDTNKSLTSLTKP